MKEREGVGALDGLPEFQKKAYFKIKRSAGLLSIRTYLALSNGSCWILSMAFLVVCHSGFGASYTNIIASAIQNVILNSLDFLHQITKPITLLETCCDEMKNSFGERQATHHWKMRELTLNISGLKITRCRGRT